MSATPNTMDHLADVMEYLVENEYIMPTITTEQYIAYHTQKPQHEAHPEQSRIDEIPNLGIGERFYSHIRVRSVLFDCPERFLEVKISVTEEEARHRIKWEGYVYFSPQPPPYKQFKHYAMWAHVCRYRQRKRLHRIRNGDTTTIEYY